MADQGNSSSAKSSPRSVRLSIFYSIDSSVPGLVEDPVLSQSRLAPPPVDPSQVVKVVLQPGDNQVVLQAFSSGALLAGCVLNQPQGPDNHQVGGLQTPRVVKSHSCQYLDSEFCPVSAISRVQATKPQTPECLGIINFVCLNLYLIIVIPRTSNTQVNCEFFNHS